MPLTTVQVTQDDIDKGTQKDAWTCPICRALFRTTGVKWVVTEDNCYPLDNRSAHIPLPPEAKAFISTFDETYMGKPFAFELDVPWGFI